VKTTLLEPATYVLNKLVHHAIAQAGLAASSLMHGFEQTHAALLEAERQDYMHLTACSALPVI
jgi:hypothetical protein